MITKQRGIAALIMLGLATGAQATDPAVEAVGECCQLGQDPYARPVPLYTRDGGHGMLFTAFDGRLMMVLHAPNGREARPHLFEMEDTGATLEVVQDLPAAQP